MKHKRKSPKKHSTLYKFKYEHLYYKGGKKGRKSMHWVAKTTTNRRKACSTRTMRPSVNDVC